MKKFLLILMAPILALAQVTVIQPTGSYTNNSLVRRDGSANKVKNSPIIVDDSGNATGFGSLTANALIATSSVASPLMTGAEFSATVDGLGATTSNAVDLFNTTASTSIVTAQVSPSLHFQGHAWKSAATAADRWVDWRIWNQPVTGGANATGNLMFDSSVSTTSTPSYTNRMSLSSAGALGIASLSASGNGTFGAGVTATSGGANSSIYFTASGLKISDLNASGFGGTLQINASSGWTADRSITFDFTGDANRTVSFGDGGTVLYSGGSYVSSITGTVGQITASASTGAVTLSLPSALTGIQSITGIAGNMTVVAGTGNSRTLTLQTTTSGGTATNALVLNATQDATIGGDLTVSGGDVTLTGASTITGGAGNMVITAGTGNSRTLTLKNTSSSGVAISTLTLNGDNGDATVAGDAFVQGGDLTISNSANINGGTGNMTITSGTGASRTMALRTTTSGSTATTALTLGADQSALIAGPAAVDGAAISSSTGLNLPAATTALSSLRLAHGAAPTSPVNGDMWTTTSALFVRINGGTVQLGAASAPGSDTQVIFNDSSAFGADAGMTYNKTTDIMTLAGGLTVAGTPTGIVTITGSTSGSLKITTADATAQVITISGAAQTSGATTLTIPDMAGSSQTFSFIGKAETLSGAKTFSGGVLASGANANDFSGGSGTFKTSTGANTIGGAATFNSTLSLGGTALSFGALPSGATTSGALETVAANTYTVTGTNTATAFQAVYNGAPTITDASAGTVTDLFSENWVAPVAAGSLTATRKHTLGILDSTSASSSITGGLVVAATYGTTATSVGIGGGNINAGGTGTFGGTLTASGTIELGSATATTLSGSAGVLSVEGNAVGMLPTTQTWTGINTFSPTARSSGAAAYLTITTPADTAQTASTESIGINKTAATRQWSTGALTTQREVVFGAPTYGFVGSSTLTTAVNVDFSAPIAGTNATLTNRWATRADRAQVTSLFDASSATSQIGPLVDSVDGTTPLNNIVQTVASGTSYTMTTSYAAVAFGTTSPTVTLPNAGTYAVYIDLQTQLASATVTTQSLSFKLRRNNNTPADLTGATFGAPLPVQTAGSELGPSIHIGPIKYTTANTTDIIEVQGTLSGALGAGTATVSNATITAIRMY